MASSQVIISNLNIGGNTPISIADVKVKSAGLALANVKEIALVEGTNDFGIDFNNDFFVGVSNIKRVFDRATYTMDAGETLHFGAQGGTIDASEQITSTLTHGDGAIDVVAYSGNPIVTVSPNVSPRERTGSVVLTQNGSGLVSMLNWIQDAAS